MLGFRIKELVAYLRFYGHLFVENILLYGGKMIGRFIFPFFLLFGKEGDRVSYYPEDELKSSTRVFFEQLWYIILKGEINKYYYRFGFDRKSKTDFKNYVPWLTFTNARNRKNQFPSQPSYDPYNYVCMMRDKFIFEAFCIRTGIKTPVNFGMINEGLVYILKTQKLILIEDIQKFTLDVFLKRNVSYGGGMSNDVMKLNIHNRRIFLNENLININEFVTLVGKNNWVLQERISNQHPVLSKLHPSSINTIRIITVKIGSEISVLHAKLRIGVNGKFSDNTSSGGISIDIEDGKLTKWGIYNKSGLGNKTAAHPNTNLVFKNYCIPQWDELVATVKYAHKLFYGLHSVGWDACVTNNGIMLIEGNDNWDTITVQNNSRGKEHYLKYFKE